MTEQRTSAYGERLSRLQGMVCAMSGSPHNGGTRCVVF